MVKRFVLTMAVTLALASPIQAQQPLLVDAVNAERSKAGLPQLAYGGALAYFSRQNDLAQFHRMACGHFAPLGTARRQNAAWGQTSVAEVVQDWMGSPGHRANILATDVSRCGGDYYWGFWSLSFGGPMPNQPITKTSMASPQGKPKGVVSQPPVVGVEAIEIKPCQAAISRTVSPNPAAWVACSSNAPACQPMVGHALHRLGRLRLFRWRCR